LCEKRPGTKILLPRIGVVFVKHDMLNFMEVISEYFVAFPPFLDLFYSE